MFGEFAGFTYGIREGLAVKVATPLYYVWQRGTDGYLFGVTGGLRGRLVKKPRWSAFWEFELGVSEADTYVPPRGTRFNYLAIGGGGMTVRSAPAFTCWAASGLCTCRTTASPAAAGILTSRRWGRRSGCCLGSD